MLFPFQGLSRPSTKLSLQSSALGLSHPLTRRRERGWGANSNERTDTVALWVHFVAWVIKLLKSLHPNVINYLTTCKYATKACALQYTILKIWLSQVARWWLLNWILRHITKYIFCFFAVSSMFDFKDIKKCSYDKKIIFFYKCNMAIKRWCWCWIRIRWKSCKKTRAKKVTSEEVTEK